jgi:hypothetical protein
MHTSGKGSFMVGSDLIISRVLNRAEETWSIEEATGARLPDDDRAAIADCRKLLVDLGKVSAEQLQHAPVHAEVHRRNKLGLRDVYIEIEAPWPTLKEPPQISRERLDQFPLAEAHAQALARSGDWDAALSLQRRLVELRLALHGPGDRATLRVANNHAGMLGACGRQAEATEVFGMVVADAERYFGELSEDTLTYFNNLAESVRKQGLTDRAIQLHQNLLARRLMVHAPRETAVTVAAWQLFKSACGLRNDLARWAFNEHIGWLSGAPVEHLSPSQRELREEVVRLSKHWA